MFIAGFVIGFVKGWKMALVITSVTPLVVISGIYFISGIGYILGGFVGMLAAKFSTAGQTAYAEAGGITSVLYLVV